MFYNCWAKFWKKLRALSTSFSLFLSKQYSATQVIRRYGCELPGNLDGKQGNIARKYFETKALFNKGINYIRSAKRMNVLRLWEARTRFAMLESLFTRLFNNSLRKWTHIQHCKPTLSSVFILQPLFVSRVKFGNQSILNSKANFVAWKVTFPFFSEWSII